MLRKTTILVMAICMNFMAIIPGAYADDKILIMPKDLIEIAEKNGYEQVDDFYNLPGMLEPCYIYGYKDADKRNSAVFWVKKKGEKKRNVYLFFVSRNFAHEPYIVDEILHGGKYGYGLSLFQDTTMTLDEFHLDGDYNVKGPKDVSLSGQGIKVSYDGVGEFMYKYNNKWYVRDFH